MSLQRYCFLAIYARKYHKIILKTSWYNCFVISILVIWVFEKRSNHPEYTLKTH